MTTSLRRPTLTTAGLLLAVAAAAALVGLGSRPADAIPFPSPVYQIIATSNGHTASLLNLPLGQPGVPQVPVPVDVNGDLLPDVTMAVNLVEVGGVINNPPDPAAVLQPNVQVDRLLTAPILGQTSPPLRIEARLRLVDLGGSGPDTSVRFGYDTGAGGSIPPTFKAVLGGLTELFNPLRATVDTGPLAGKPISYQGPLTIVGQIQTGPMTVDLGFGFSPLPNRLELGYATDDDGGQHLTYAHSAPREVDLTAAVAMVDADSELHVDARIERLPGRIAVDIGDGGSGGGDIAFTSDSDGRRPDVRVHLASRGGDGDPLYADIDLDSLPRELAARWSLPEAGPAAVTFDAGGQGIGGIDIDIRDHDPATPGALPAFVASERQYLSILQAPSPDGDAYQRISGRVERVRHVDFSDEGVDGGVLTAHVSMGDGEQPLQLAYDCRIDCSGDGTVQAVDVDATVAPLPDDFTVTIDGADPDDPLGSPMIVDYRASEPADVDGRIRLVGEHGTPASACGALATTCADLLVRDVPTALTATIASATTDLGATMAVELELGDGSLPPDLAGTVVLGPNDPDDPAARPMVAEVDARHLPDRASVLVHQRIDPATGQPALDHARFDACDADAPVDCAPGSGIGELRVAVRNHLGRPPGFPVAPAPGAPVHASVTQRADDFALEARFADLRRVELIDNGSILGLRTDVGDGTEPFAATIDIEGSPLGDGHQIREGDPGADPPLPPIVLDGATQDLSATAYVGNLPSHFELCMRSPNRTLVPTGEPFTARCEGGPFSAPAEPLAIAYDLGAPATVRGTFEQRVQGTDQLTDAHYEQSTGGEVTIPELPERMATHVLLPPEGQEGPIHAVYDAAAGIDEMTVGIHSTVGDDAECMDPRDPVTALCLDVRVEAIPRYLELRYDPTSDDDNLLFQARSKAPGDPGIELPILDRTDLRDLTLSSVAPDAATGTQRALLLTGEIEDLPTTVHGTLALPETTDEPTAIQFCASADPCGPDATPGAPIGRITVDARNIVVADPTPLADGDPTNDMPGQRAAEGGTLPDPTDEVVLYQRGEAFHARVDLSGVRGAGYRTVVAESGRPSGTQVLNLDLETDPPPVLRAYVDLDAGTSHLIADATLQGVPPATVICFRGADLDPDDDVDPAVAPFCETRPTDREGAFELATLPGQDTSGLDVDAFVRQATGGGADVLASRVRLTDIPAYVRATFPADGPGSLDVRGYDATEAPKGFGAIDAEVATFDLRPGADGDGYAPDATPFVRKAPAGGVERAPAPAPGRQHLALVHAGEQMNARARVFGLQQLALRDGACDAAAVDPGAVRFDTRPDHPTYPEPPEGQHPYTCVRTVVDSGAGQPMDLHVSVDLTPPGTGRPQILSLTDARLTAVPSAMELVLADPPDVSGGAARPEPCPTVGSADDPPFDCVPAMIRFDQTGAGQLEGTLQIGDVLDLEIVDGIVPGGNAFDQAAFAGIHEMPPGTGVRALVGMYAGEDEDDRLAVTARFRFDVPGSLTVDAPDSASGTDFTDFRFHYAVRDQSGAIDTTLGDMLVLLEQADGSQVLASGDGLHGAQIPGELALAVYLRESILLGETLLQIDGVTSTELDLNAVMLTPHETGLDPEQAAVLGIDPTPLTDRKAFQLRGLAPGPFTNWYDPSFRVQVQLLDAPYQPPGPYGPGTTDEDSCDAIDCEAAYARVDEIRASIDLDPPGTEGRARMVRVAMDIRTNEKRGEFRAFQSVHAPLGAQGDAQISATANLSIDPMRLYVFKGIPFLGNLEVDIDLSIDVAVHLDRVSSFLFGNDAMHIEAEAIGAPGNASAIGPVSIIPHTLFAGVQGPLNVTVAGIEYVGGFFGEDLGEPLELDFASCQAGDLLAGFTPAAAIDEQVQQFLDIVDLTADNSVPLSADTSVVVLPEIDGNFAKYGLGNIVTDLLKPFVQSIACAATDVDLKPLLNGQIPGTPADAEVNGRPVPPGVVLDVQPPEPEPAPVAVDATLPGGSMCGLHRFRVVHITGPITVAGTPGPTCPAGSESTLSIAAEEIHVDPGGSIDASAVVTGGCTPGSINVRFPQGRSPLDSLFDCAAYLASNDGAPHVEDGGKGGRSGLFDPEPDAYAASILGIVPGGLSEAGWRGGGAQGGRGGGTIGLSAERIILAGDLLANGGDGGDGGGGPCAGSGGGSGGAVVIDASYVRFDGGRIHADGGDGANGGGGGSAGQVLLSGGVLGNYVDGTTATVASGSGASTGDCAAGDPTDGPIGGPEVAVELEARTELLSLGEFWQTSYRPDGTNQPDDDDNERDWVGLTLPFRAAATDFGTPYASSNQRPYQVLLCDVHFPPTFTDYSAGIANFFPNHEGNWRDHPCGLSDPFDLGYYVEYARIEDQIVVPAGGEQVRSGAMAFDRVTLLNGYHGLYTRAFVGLVDGNDCIEDDWFGDPTDPTPVTDFTPNAGQPSDEVLAARAFDTFYCRPAEPIPPDGQGAPELIIGVDNSAPSSVTLTPLLPDSQKFPADPQAQRPHPYAYSAHEVVRFTTSADDLVDNVRLSGLDSVVCYLESSHNPDPDAVLGAVDCAGPEPWAVDLYENIDNIVVLRATDKLGNWRETRWSVRVDEEGPGVTVEEIVPDPSIIRANGWFSAAPQYRIGGFEDLGGSGPANGIYYWYRIDEGQEHECPEDPQVPGTCLVDPDHLPDEGRHVLHAYGYDLVGNRTGDGWIVLDPDAPSPRDGVTAVIRIDRTEPTSGAFVAPLTPSGANGWWNVAPWLGVVGFDRPVGGAGFVPLPGDPVTDPSVAFLEYSLDGGPFTPWGGPFRLGDGDHEVCTIAGDLAGNPWQTPPQSVCTPTPIRVDTVPPLVVLPASGPAGDGGWFTGPVAVTPLALDAGSGVEAVHVAVDGGPYAPWGGGDVTIGEGVHVVRAYAVDVAGNRSPVVEREVRVDRSRPVSTLRTSPAAPARNGWYRMAPLVTLRATHGDQNAGVGAIVWCAGAGCTPSTAYAGPFRVGGGTTVLRWQAVDAAGAANLEPVREVVLRVDDAPPTVRATLPSAVIWSRLLGDLGLGPKTVGLRYAVGDDRSGPVRVTVIVYDTLGTAVRRLEAGTVNVPPGGTVTGTVQWDGRNDTLSGLVPLGVYHYRVIATDDAGNVAQSAESRPITIQLL